MATKKAESKDAPARQYRVLRSFREGGVLISSDGKGQVADLPPAVRKSRLERGYIEELRPASSATEAADKAKE